MKLPETIIITNHALKRYRERINNDATEPDVITGFKKSKLIPKDKDAWYTPWLHAHTKPNTTYFHDAESNILYITEQGNDDMGRVLRIVTVLNLDEYDYSQPKQVQPVIKDKATQIRDNIKDLQDTAKQYLYNSPERKAIGQVIHSLYDDIKELRRHKKLKKL